jgi:hypothetical protein
VLAGHLDGRSRLDSGAVRAAGERLEGRSAELGALLDGLRPDPADLWPLRGIASALATVARLGVEDDWLALARAGIEGGP